MTSLRDSEHPPARHARKGSPQPAGSGARRPAGAAGRRRRSWGSRIVGGIGELFITLGVLGLLFVVWELWWTGLDADQDRQAATDEFYSSIEAPAASSEAGSDAAADDDGTPEEILDLVDGEGAMAMVYAPRLGEDWAAPVRSGVEPASLDRAGLGHYPSTQLPGEPGNFALAGHRQTHGSILWDQDTFVAGDRIYLHSPDGYYTYEVRETQVVQPHQSEVLAPVPNEPAEQPEETSWLTLTTCHPPYTTLERMVTHAELVDFEPLSQEPPSVVSEQVEQQTSTSGGL